MALFDAYKRKSNLIASIKQTAKARAAEGTRSGLLFTSAYQGFADVVKGDLVMGEALFNWGFALLHQAKAKGEEESVKLYLEAISKFNFCLLVTPNHLGAAIDGGVSYMDLARIMGAEANDELYDLAEEFFGNAERIQRGSAAYNLACIYGIRGQDDACAEALALSKEYSSLPSVEDITSDPDLLKVKNAAWFIEFIEKMKAGPEPVVIDKTEITYDAEGNVNNRKKKKKQFENEVDGVVYDAEGNVLRGEGESEDVTEEGSAESVDKNDEAGEAKTTEAKGAGKK